MSMDAVGGVVDVGVCVMYGEGTFGYRDGWGVWCVVYVLVCVWRFCCSVVCCCEES